jgi:DNA replication and repair protein RecF
MEGIKLSKLSVQNFRNLNMGVLEFGPGINCILGENGNGKTNLLEVVYYLAYKKSFRKKTGFSQILSIDVDKPEILLSSAFLNSDDKEFAFSGKVNPESHDWYKDGKPTKSRLGAEVIFINPFDSYAFHNQPVFRRDWMDRHLGILNKSYKTTLNKYQQLIRQRNALLTKKPPQFRQLVKTFDAQFVEYSHYLLGERNNFIAELNGFLGKTFQRIFSAEHELELVIDSHFHGLERSQIQKRLDENFEKDCERGTTSKGVHRDDYLLQFDGFLSYEFCSLGQQKMSFLALLFAYIELFRYKFTTYPIVLIDDVSGELDRTRWKNLVDYLKGNFFQVLITTANEDFRKELESIEGVRKIFVSTGTVENIQ